MTSGLDPPPTGHQPDDDWFTGSEAGIGRGAQQPSAAPAGSKAAWRRSIKAGERDGILKRDNSDPDAASELPPRCRRWICGTRAGVGLRNGGLNRPSGQMERFGGKLACWPNYKIMQLGVA